MEEYMQNAEYMEEEEEWDREGLLDPAWEKQQKKVSVYSAFSAYFHVFIVKISPDLSAHGSMGCV